MDTRADDTLDAAPPGDRGLSLQVGVEVGRYAIVERIGAGGMGEVYRAHDPELRRDVALKLVKPDRMRGRGGAEHRARLLREARAMAQLTHQNVLRVYDVGEHDGGVFVAMELVVGIDGAKWIRLEPRNWREVLRVFRAAGRGLAEAHNRGLVHRDFKPANILLGDDQRVQVTDFGLARAAEDIRGDDPQTPDPSWSEEVTSQGVVVGTPAYMAPEQFLGLPADARSDQYAYCVSLWEALFQRLPFPGRNPRAIGAAKANDELRLPSPESDVPHELIAVLQRGMAADRERRFPAMRDVLRALREVVERGATTPSPSPHARRMPWAVFGAAALGGLVAWLFMRGDPCVADAHADAMRDAYVSAIDEGDLTEAGYVARRLADHWRARECPALAREWSALAR